jgi:hypothetical protein
MVQYLILGPMLYGIFVSPIFDIADMPAFADDTFIPKAWFKHKKNHNN